MESKYFPDLDVKERCWTSISRLSVGYSINDGFWVESPLKWEVSIGAELLWRHLPSGLSCSSTGGGVKSPMEHQIEIFLKWILSNYPNGLNLFWSKVQSLDRPSSVCSSPRLLWGTRGMILLPDLGLWALGFLEQNKVVLFEISPAPVTWRRTKPVLYFEVRGLLWWILSSCWCSYCRSQ